MTARAVMAPHTDFELPPELEADRPPELRGLRRDQVRLLVARPDGVRHRRFHDLAEELGPGDLLVVNTSATLPAALDVVRRIGAPPGRRGVLHVSTRLDDGRWVVEVRRPAGDGPAEDVAAGEVLRLPGRHVLTVRAAHPDGGPGPSRLWTATVEPAADILGFLAAHGRPVTYRYVSRRYPLRHYQTVFADEPGSAEMPSAARPVSPRLLVRLAVRGVVVTPVLLHAGLSSAESGESPAAERFAVPEHTARLVNAALSSGRRVVAAGTTVVRALESAADRDGRVHARHGWTDRIVDARRPPRVVNALVTGWHAPRASHLSLLEAVAGPELVRGAYGAALDAGYLWHEFGDSALLLP